MNNSKKRASPDDSNVNKENKKKQTTLFSMFKSLPPKETTTATATKQTPTLESPAVAEQQKTDNDTKSIESIDRARALFEQLDDETKNLLHLEMTTMQYEWLRVLQPELTKPYFIKVRRIHDHSNEYLTCPHLELNLFSFCCPS
jgi:uracil-DNA glycosylase